jgi:hypothetical protein
LKVSFYTMRAYLFAVIFIRINFIRACRPFLCSSQELRETTNTTTLGWKEGSFDGALSKVRITFFHYFLLFFLLATDHGRG